MNLFRNWMEDLPQQFRGKKNISILIKAFSRQMDEVEQAFRDIDNLTTLDHAFGKTLDYVGSILNLSRKDAHIILRKTDTAEITDDVYRAVLQYKAIKNTCDCTYEDIMGSMKLLWDMEPIEYYENPKRPATIYIRMPTMDIDIADPTAKRILAIKPSGVAIIYKIIYITGVNTAGIEKSCIPQIVVRMAFSFWQRKILDGSWNLDGSILLDSVFQKLTTRCKYCVAEVKNLEKVSTSMVIKKNAWYLDGNVKLDGTKKLNAEIIKEEL